MHEDYFLSAGKDRTLRRWNLAIPSLRELCVAAIRKHRMNDEVMCIVVFSPNAFLSELCFSTDLFLLVLTSVCVCRAIQSLTVRAVGVQDVLFVREVRNMQLPEDIEDAILGTVPLKKSLVLARHRLSMENA